MGTVGVAPAAPRRPPRMPGGELALEPPPEPERVVPAGMLMRLLPVVMLLGLGRLHRRARRAQPDVVAVRRHVRASPRWAWWSAAAAPRRRARGGRHRRGPPRLPALPRRSCAAGCGASPPSSARRWRRCTPIPQRGPRCSRPAGCGSARPADPDFGQLRIGRGAQRLATRLVAPQTGPVEGLEPVTALALRRFLRAHAVVPDLPVALSLRASSTVWLEPADPAPAGARPGAGPGGRRAVRAAGTARPTRCSPSSRRRRSLPSGSGPSGCRTCGASAPRATPSARCG